MSASQVLPSSPHQPLASSPDVVIVGGGLAGSCLAITLRRMGMRITIVERTNAFQDRIRGETIHPWGTREIRELGLYELAVNRANALPQSHWLTYLDREPNTPYTWADDFPNAPNGLSVRHDLLQQVLLNAALREGVTVFRPAEVKLCRPASRLTATISGPFGELTLHPRFVVGADGQRSATRTWIGGSARRNPIHHAIGGALITNLDLEPDRVHQAFFPGGFALITPQADKVSRVYLVCSSAEASGIQQAPEPARAFMSRVESSLPIGSVGNWSSIGPLGFFPNANIVAAYPNTKDVILIGDAAGANDPSQGHGISLAVHDSRVLREIFDAGMAALDVPGAFAERRRAYFEVLRRHARWNERLSTETGPAIEAIRDRISRARDRDPSAGGFSGIFATGPDHLVADDQARRHYFGEDLADQVEELAPLQPSDLTG